MGLLPFPAFSDENAIFSYEMVIVGGRCFFFFPGGGEKGGGEKASKQYSLSTSNIIDVGEFNIVLQIQTSHVWDLHAALFSLFSTVQTYSVRVRGRPI